MPNAFPTSTPGRASTPSRQSQQQQQQQQQQSASSMSQSTSCRSWLDGTLDVISGLQQQQQQQQLRPSTPVGGRTSASSSQQQQQQHPPVGTTHRRQHSGGSIAASSQVSGPGVSASFTNAASAFLKRAGSFSAPNSPARGVTTTNNNNNHTLLPPPSTTNSPFLTIPRLPSQDSMDQMLHNDSNHGNRTSAQIIRDLKQANARLTARMAAMEADYLNQLTHVQMQLRDYQQSHQQPPSWEARCKAAEQKVREKEEYLQKLREESAFQRHSISDLKTQVLQLQRAAEQQKSGSGTGVGMGLLRSNSMGSSKGIIGSGGVDVQAIREWQALQDQVRHEKEERIRVQQELARLQRKLEQQPPPRDGHPEDEDAAVELERTRDALYRTETALTELRKDHERIQQEQERARHGLEQELKLSQESWQKKESHLKNQMARLEQRDMTTTDWQEQMKQRDDTIDELRHQVLEYSKQLTELTAQMAQLKADAESQEQYRRDEADDLRVLNDAQEEEIDRLRKQLEEALQEIEMREQELEEKKEDGSVQQQQQQSQSAPESPAGASGSRLSISRLRAELEEARQEIGRLEQEMDDMRADHADEMVNLENTIRRMQQDKPSVDSNARRDLEDENEDKEKLKDYEFHVEELKTKMIEFELKLVESEHELEDARRALKAADENEKDLANSYEQRIKDLEFEKTNLERQYKEKLDAMQIDLLDSKKEAGSSPTKPPLLPLTPSRSSSSPVDAGGRAEERAREVARLESLLEQERNMKPRNDAREDDLRKELEHAKQAEAKAQAELKELTDAKKKEIDALLEKLEDRDTTISSLVKSTVTLERELSMARMETDALRTLSRNSGGSSGINDSTEAGYDVILANSTSMDDAEALRSSLDESREAEKRLAEECDHLQEQLENARQANAALRSQIEGYKAENTLLRSQIDDEDTKSLPDSTVSAGSQTPQMQIQERDQAIASLVQRAMDQDNVVADLKRKLNQMSQECLALRARMQSGPSWEEVKELRKETEMFAGQVIEQDEEIEELKDFLRARERRIATLEIEIEELKCRPQTPPPPEPIMSPRSSKEDCGDSSEVLADKVTRLTAEVDELTEANNTLREEIRDLRKIEREHQSYAGEIDRLKREVQTYFDENGNLKSTIDSLFRQKQDFLDQIEALKAKESAVNSQEEARQRASQTIISQQSKIQQLEAKIEELKVEADKRPVDFDEMEIETLQNQISDLRLNLEHQNGAVANAKETIRELESLLAQKNAGEAAALEEEKEELLAELENLSTQLEEAQAELKQLEEQRAIIDDFKMKLEAADEAREVSEKTIVDTYERKLSLLKLDKDCTIDKLRNELSELKQTNAAEIGMLTNKLRHYEAEIERQREELTAEIEERESRINAMQITVTAHEQLVGNMKTEMDHLQGSMENNVVNRREEIEGLQQEVADMAATIAKQEREIKTLRGQLDDKKIAHELEIQKLNEKIELMQSGSENADNHSERRNALDLQMELRLKEVKDRLEKLKWRNNALTEENELLRGRLQKAEAKLNESISKLELTDQLEKELTIQKNKVEELSESLRRLREPPSSHEESTVRLAPKKPAPETHPEPATLTPPALPPTPVQEIKTTPVMTPSTSVRDKRSTTPHRPILGFLGRRRKENQDSPPEVTKA